MGPKISFEGALERCLSELARTDDVASSIQGYSQYADQLRPLLQTAQAVRHQYAAVPEPPGGLVAGRERLLAVAAEQRARGVAIGSGSLSATRMRGLRTKLAFPLKILAAMLVILMGVAALGSGVILAANGSLPGDRLYPVKLEVEDYRIAFAADPVDQVDLTLGFVEKRVEEIEALIGADRRVPEETAARLERHVEDVLDYAASVDDQEMGRLLVQIRNRTRSQAQMLTQVQANAPEQDQQNIERAAAACFQGAWLAEEGLNDAQRFRWRRQHRSDESEPKGEPVQQHERQPQQILEPTTTGQGAPLRTPYVTPLREQETAEPQITASSEMATAEPSSTPKIPQATVEPKMTPPVPGSTHGPQVTSQTDQGTPQSQSTPKSPVATLAPPRATQGPNATPHGSHGMPEQPAVSPGSQGPDSRQGGGN